MQVLQAGYHRLFGLQRFDAADRRRRGRKGGDAVDLVLHGGAPDGFFIETRLDSERAC